MNDLDVLDVPAFHLAADSSATSEPWVLLKRLRACKQGAVAAEIKMDSGQFSNVVHGKLGISLPQLKALLDALGLKLIDANAKVIDEQDFLGLTRAAAMLYTSAPHLLIRG